MSKRAKSPCEYCDHGYGELLSLTSEDSDDLVMEICPGNCISAYAYIKGADEETHEASVSIPMNYCPVCGRKWEV